ASKVKLFNAVSSQLLGDSVDVSFREDHGEATQVNVVESRSVTDELRLLESQIQLKEAEAIARRVVIRQAEAEAKAKEVGIRNLVLLKRLLSMLMDMRSWTRSPPNRASKFSTYPCSYCGKPGHKAEVCWTRLQLNTGKPAMIVTEETSTSPVGVMADLSKADSMPIGLVFTKGEVRVSAVSVLASRDFDLFQESFAKDPDVGTFLSQGTVEVDGVETPVTILRDLGCLQTLIKESVVAARKTGKYVVLGSLWGQGGNLDAGVVEMAGRALDTLLWAGRRRLTGVLGPVGVRAGVRRRGRRGVEVGVRVEVSLRGVHVPPPPFTTLTTGSRGSDL
ncbi:hypothetical protein Hamer_G027526, partial [Homarus americanus]